MFAEPGKGFLLATFFLFLMSVLPAKGQGNKKDKWTAAFDSAYYFANSNNLSFRVKWLTLSKSKDVLDFQPLSYGIDALTAMFQATGQVKYLDYNLELINNVIHSAKPLDNFDFHKSPYTDSYKTWLVYNTSKEYRSLYLMETSLSEVYIFQYITKLLLIIRNSPELYQEKKYRSFFETVMAFTEKHIWEKWYNRGLRLGMPNGQYLKGRTHIGSHWAYIALMLDKLSMNRQRKQEYKWTYTTFDHNLKRNFRPHPKKSNILIWNSTYEEAGNLVQDVSHGNLVISYIINAYENGSFWKIQDLEKLISLVKNHLWNKSNHSFLDNLDGSLKLQTSSRGGFQSDGWVKLGRFDRAIQDIYINYVQNIDNGYTRDPQLYANMALNENILSSKIK